MTVIASNAGRKFYETLGNGSMNENTEVHFVWALLEM